VPHRPVAGSQYLSETQDDSGSVASAQGAIAGLGVANAINDMIEDTLETDEREADGAPKFSENYIARMLKEYGNLYYPYAHLNETLYLNHKGFCRIMNMHMFPDLKCLHIQCNGKYVCFDFMIGLRSMLGLE
jgi:hypothetical protein